MRKTLRHILVIYLLIIFSTISEADFKEIIFKWNTQFELVEQDSLELFRLKTAIREKAKEYRNETNNPEALYASMIGFRLAASSEDSLSAENIKNQIIQKFPVSEQTFELANEEFYDKIYPIWRDDSLKVDTITELLKKYPETNWRRTLYNYLVSSLNRTHQQKKLENTLEKWQSEFPNDYLPSLRAASFLSKSDSKSALNYARKAYELSFDYPYLEYYRKAEWELEKRSATVKATSILANILIKSSDYRQAKHILEKTIKQNSLGVDDETTLGSCYFYLAL